MDEARRRFIKDGARSKEQKKSAYELAERFDPEALHKATQPVKAYKPHEYREFCVRAIDWAYESLDEIDKKFQGDSRETGRRFILGRLCTVIQDAMHNAVVANAIYMGELPDGTDKGKGDSDE